MRELTAHKVNAANEQLAIQVLDGPGPGGASHLYKITGFDSSRNPIIPDDLRHVTGCRIMFQNGVIGEAGVNGVTHEALLAILEDRLHAFQQGPYGCEENEVALMHIQAAQAALQKRTRRRLEQGIEGTMATDPGQPTAVTPGGAGNPIMRYFAFQHLPEGPLRSTSQSVADLATALNSRIKDGAEKSAGLRKLLEAKDCFVRAVLP